MPAVPFARSHADFRRCRCSVDRSAEFRPARHHARDPSPGPVGWTKLIGIACEKPLGRTLSEAREMLRLATDASLLHGYLENQVFSSAVQRGKDIVWRRAVPICGRPYLARAAEEHFGPHTPWFWQAQRQGGGVLSDMTCHSVEVGRFLLSKPGAPRSDLKLISASASVGNLKWTRPEYVTRLKNMMGPDVDYAEAAGRGFCPRSADLSRQARATRSWSKQPIPGPMSARACVS